MSRYFRKVAVLKVISYELVALRNYGKSFKMVYCLDTSKASPDTYSQY